MNLTNEHKVLQQIINEAWQDEAFKKKLVDNPKEAIKKLTGEKLNLPEGKELVVRDQTDENTIFINIPTNPNMKDVELSESQLEAVSGGTETPGDRQMRELLATISAITRAM